MTAAGESKRIRVAVAGCGEFGRNHARVYREMESAELAGVFDRDATRAAAFAQEFNTRAFSTLQEMRAQVDAASVAVPTIAHAEVGCALMQLGIDVLVEKPMATPCLLSPRSTPEFCRSATSNDSIPRCWRLSQSSIGRYFLKCIVWEF